jgi:hypothetical protein
LNQAHIAFVLADADAAGCIGRRPSTPTLASSQPARHAQERFADILRFSGSLSVGAGTERLIELHACESILEPDEPRRRPGLVFKLKGDAVAAAAKVKCGRDLRAGIRNVDQFRFGAGAVGVNDNRLGGLTARGFAPVSDCIA